MEECTRTVPSLIFTFLFLMYALPVLQESLMKSFFFHFTSNMKKEITSLLKIKAGEGRCKDWRGRGKREKERKEGGEGSRP